MNEKYLYFRTVSTLTDDDDDDSSCLFPVSSYRGSWTFNATSIVMYFKSMHEKTMIGGSSYDNVVVNITTNQHKNFLNKLFENICTGEDYLITVGDDVDEVYSANVASIGSITVTVNND
jgi:hypothetical protein